MPPVPPVPTPMAAIQTPVHYASSGVLVGGRPRGHIPFENPESRILNCSDFYYTTFLTPFCNFIPCILYHIYLIMYIYLLNVLILAVGLD